MKRIGFFLGLVLSYFLLLPQVGVAYGALCPQGGGFDNLCNIDLAKGDLVGKIVTVLLIIAVILCLFFLIWGGVRWIMSGGDKAKVDQARSTIVAAIVGLVIAFLAYAILSFVVYIFTGSSLNSLSLPTTLF